MIINADCLNEMRKMEANSISAIVTDPPYGLSFMGKGWDHAIPGKEYWEECKRLLKPGSFLLAMGGTRTFHRLTCAIEDVGLEIRDCISWLYGSGFPKSHNNFGIEGYGTALKPAWEPIIMAMKPCDGTFKQNAEKWGQAGINIKACRIGIKGATKRSHQAEYPKNKDGREDRSKHWARTGHNVKEISKGRWPANLILDEEAGQMLDEQSGIKASRFFYCAKASPSERNDGLDGLPETCAPKNGAEKRLTVGESKDVALPRSNNHPTVKPLKLMEYLIKLVMPLQGGMLLDPFAGSGTTILAAMRLGFDSIGIEKDEGYCEIAKARLESFSKKHLLKENQQYPLFAQIG